MDDLVQAVVDEVLRRQGAAPGAAGGPRAAGGRRVALCHGRAAMRPSSSLADGRGTAALPDEASAQALLEGKPSTTPEGLDYRRHAKTANRALWSALLAAERRLRTLGVQELAQKSALVTAEEARRLLHSGLP